MELSYKDAQGGFWLFYTDREGKWRWRRCATSGKLLGDDSEAFTLKKACFKNAKKKGFMLN